MTPDGILDSLDPEQREVATTLHGPVCVLAGAGTGKTRAITHRIAYGVRVNAYDPRSILAVTFTTRAASEMRDRLRRLGVPGVTARTFHSAALRQLRYFWPEVVGGRLPAIVAQKAFLVGRAAKSIGLSIDRLAVRDLASEIEWAKVSLIAPQDYPTVAPARGRPLPAGLAYEVVADVMLGYEEAKTADVSLDFEDILLVLADVLGRNREVAAALRSQYRHFVVDEYQDVSPLQQLLLEGWLGGRDDLCVVGDPAQTIYSFAGATPSFLLGFQVEYPHAALVRLVRDYRSTPQIVHLANTLNGGGGETIRLVAQRASGAEVSFRVFGDDMAEAAGIADLAASLISSGVPASEIAVLYRTNGQSEAFEEALTARGIGYVVRGGTRFFEREEIRRAVLSLRAAAVVVGDGDVPTLVREALVDCGWSEEAPAERGAVRERWDSLQAVVGLADGWGGDLKGFVADLEERAEAQHAPTVDGVSLTTLHAAKGLEWDAVFIAGLSDGLVPISLADTEEALAEEKRLLYVGVTRARTHLVLSYSRARKEGGRSIRKPTRFLARRWPDVRRASPAPRKTAAADLSAPDLRLFEELKAWRLAHAEAEAKPAFTVLVDTSLAEIALRRPRTLGELATVRGIGPSKLDRYGREILDLVASDSLRAR
ncbi:MAG: ATP-dependent DNA helicase UvrD2 [Demequinaceae bacterium]|nr:ATP-dependent DNA helicase UvrD2 [Demequinaceae bacterium]